MSNLNKHLQLNLDEKVHVVGFIGSEHINSKHNPYFYKHIDGLFEVRLEKHGLSVVIQPNGHGAEQIWVKCITQPIINLYAQEELSYEMKGAGLAGYFKILDVREGSIPINDFNEVLFRTQNKK